MVLSTEDNSIRGRCLVMGRCDSLMAASTQDSGKMEDSMEKVCSMGRTDLSMQGAMCMGRRRVTGCGNGLMGATTKENGRMIDVMGMELFIK